MPLTKNRHKNIKARDVINQKMKVSLKNEIKDIYDETINQSSYLWTSANVYESRNGSYMD